MALYSPFLVKGGVKDGVADLSVGIGFVNWREPLVNGTRLSGIDSSGNWGAAPRVTGTVSFDKYNRSYVCLKVRVDDNGQMPPDPDDTYLSVVISDGVRRSHNFEKDMGYWLHPIATISEYTLDGEVCYSICQNVYFNLLHWVGLTEGRVGDVGSAAKYHHYFAAL